MTDPTKLHLRFETKDGQTSIILLGSGVIQGDLIVARGGDDASRSNGRPA